MKLPRSGSTRIILICIGLALSTALLSAEPRITLVAKPAKVLPGATPAPDNNGTIGVGQRLTRQPAATPAPVATTTTTTTTTTSSGAAPDAVLVALGTLGASNLYYSYLTLGTTADGFVGGTYNGQVAISVANEAIFMNGNARGGLAKLIDSPTIAREDRDVLVVMVQTYDILNNQAKALIQFISDDKDDGSTYQKYRAEAWKRIVDLFGIK